MIHHCDSDVPVYLYRDIVDFRKSINGLSAIVQEAMSLDVFSAAMFVFCNRQRSQIKLLYWHKNGFCLWLKRLEKDKFAWPRKLSDETITIDQTQLRWLLDGFDIFKHPPHATLHYHYAG